MPYITKDRRDAFSMSTRESMPPDNAGDLNYLLTRTVLESEDPAMLDSELRAECDVYIKHKGLRYAFINDVMGALAGAKREMTRRMHIHKYDSLFDGVAAQFYDEVAAPYEDTKIAENGDVYPVKNDGLGHDLEGARRD